MREPKDKQVPTVNGGRHVASAGGSSVGNLNDQMSREEAIEIVEKYSRYEDEDGAVAELLSR